MIFEPKKRIISHDENKRLVSIFAEEENKVKYYRNCDEMYTIVPHYNYYDGRESKTIMKQIYNEELKDFDLYDINFLDFKITNNCFEGYDYEELLWKYLNFGNSPKVLHVVSARDPKYLQIFLETFFPILHSESSYLMVELWTIGLICWLADKGKYIDLFLDKEWDNFCNLINESVVVKNKVHLEIHNVLPVTPNNLHSYIKNNITNDFKFDITKLQIVDYHLIVSNSHAYYVNVKCDDEIYLENFDIQFYNPFADRDHSEEEPNKHV